MSSEALSWAKRQTAGSTGPKATLLLLADVASEHGVLWYSVDRLHKLLECSRATMIRHLQALHDIGLIVRYEYRKPNGARKYKVTVLGPLNDCDRGAMVDPREHGIYGPFLTDKLGWDDRREPLSLNLDETLSRNLEHPKSQFGASRVSNCDPNKQGVNTDSTTVSLRSTANACASESSLDAARRLYPTLSLTQQRVLTQLVAVATARKPPPWKPETLIAACDRYSDRDHVDAAEGFREWYVEGRGQNVPVRSLAGRWATWLRMAAPATATRNASAGRQREQTCGRSLAERNAADMPDFVKVMGERMKLATV